MKFQLSITTWLLLAQQQDAFIGLTSTSRQQSFYRAGVPLGMAADSQLKDLLSEYSGSNAAPPPSVPDVVASVSEKVDKITIKTPLADEFLRAAREQTGSLTSSLSDSVTTPADTSTVSEFFRSMKQNAGSHMVHTDTAKTIKPAFSHSTPTLAEVKAPILTDFVKQQADGVQSLKQAVSEGYATGGGEAIKSTNDALKALGTVSAETTKRTTEVFQANGAQTLENIEYVKAKFGIIGNNIRNFFNLPDPRTLTGEVTMPDLPTTEIGWAVAGTALILAAGQRTAGASDMKKRMNDLVAKEALAVEELMGEMVRRTVFVCLTHVSMYGLSGRQRLTNFCFALPRGLWLVK